jgi:hypothetical protein
MLKNAPAPDPTAAMDPSKMMGPMVNQVYNVYITLHTALYTMYCLHDTLRCS